MSRYAARWMASRPGLTPSIRTRLIVVVCVCLAPVAALILRSALGHRDLLVAKAGEQLVTSATLHAAKVDHLVDRTAVMLHAVRETGPVRGADPLACRETLRRVVADVGFVNGLGVSDTSGDKFCHTNATSPVNLADRPFFQAALRGSLAVGSVVMARTNGKPILPMALPVFDAAGRTWRVLTTGIPIATVEAAVGGAPLPRGADLTITDARGGVVVSTMPALAFGVAAPWTGLTRDDSGTVAWDGRLLGFAAAHGGDLLVVVSQPRAEFLAASDRLFARELGLMVVVVLLAALLAAVVAEFAFARRLRTLAGVAAGLAGGDLSARADLPGGGGDEIGRLAHAVNDMAGSLEVTINDLAAREAAARHDAMHDPLTQLPNRLLLRDRLGEVLLRCRRYGERAAVLYIDLDRFKEVNDSLGHAAGDILLATCAERLKACARATDTVARLGGDEFAVLQTDVEHSGDVRALCERIAAALAQPFCLDGQEFVVGASVGIALAPDDGEDAGLLMRNADIALYRAKADGRGRACFFKVGMDEQIRRRKALEGDLRHALAAGQLEVHYQPQVDAGSAAVLGVEALLRWRHPERGMVPPVEFIPVAEETGLIIPIGEWVLRIACADAARWPGLKMSVNVSPVQFRQRDLVASVERALDDAGLPPDRLELEITEGVLMQSTTEAVRILERLKRLGVQIAMDDFGTGYSSLSYLQKFPFDKIKIDRSFVGGLRRRPQNRAIIRAVVGISQSFGMITCAEGVETADDLAALREEGCEQAQGYLFGRPAPATAIDALLHAEAAARIGPGNGRVATLALPAPGQHFEGALAL